MSTVYLILTIIGLITILFFLFFTFYKEHSTSSIVMRLITSTMLLIVYAVRIPIGAQLGKSCVLGVIMTVMWGINMGMSSYSLGERFGTQDIIEVITPLKPKDIIDIEPDEVKSKDTVRNICIK